eukprot:scaffold25.g5103.t1
MVHPADASEAAEPLLADRAAAAAEESGGAAHEGHLARLLAALAAAWRRLLDALAGALAPLLAPLARWGAGRRVAPAPPPLTPLAAERLAALQARVGVPYDPACEAHAAALRALWAAGFPGQPFPPGVRSPQWKEMGWQGEDPATDFRRVFVCLCLGAGLLALECLLHLATRRSDDFRRLMRKADGARSDWEYPFAAAGVNLTFMLTGAGARTGVAGRVQLLDLRRAPAPTPATPAGAAFVARVLPASRDAFEGLFALSFLLLDRVWLEQGASYMEFPAVLREVRRRVDVALCGGEAQSLAELEAALLAPAGG